jgi:hypothetical protein
MNIADAKQAQPQALMPWKVQDQPTAEVVKRCAWVKVKTAAARANHQEKSHVSLTYWRRRKR